MSGFWAVSLFFLGVWVFFFFGGGCLGGFFVFFCFVFCFRDWGWFFASFFWRRGLGGFFVLFLFFLRRGFGRLFFALFSEALFKRKRGVIWAGAGAVSFVGPFFIHLPFLMDLVDRSVFFFSLPFLYLPFLCGVNAISCHDANRVFSFLIVSHDDILQTYVRMQGSRNQDVPTPLLTYAVFLVILLCIRRFLPLLTLCIHSPLSQTTPHTIVYILILIYTSLFPFSHRAFFSFLLTFERFTYLHAFVFLFLRSTRISLPFPSLPFLQYSFLSFFFVPQVD